MCRCTPSIKSPWCPKCVTPTDTVQYPSHMYRIEEDFVKVKETIKIMDGLSEDGFNNRHMNDPAFNKTISLLVDLISYKKHKGGCKFCSKGESLVTGKTNDIGMTICYPNKLMAYGYNVKGFGSNGISVTIKYCPMCGREL